MPPANILDLIQGSGGAIVVMALLLYSIVRMRILVPGWYADGQEKRIGTLSEENKALTSELSDKDSQLTDLKIVAAKLEGQVSQLSTEVERLTSEVSRLQKRLERDA